MRQQKYATTLTSENTYKEKGKIAFEAISYYEIKSNLHCTRGIMPKRVTSSGAHLRDLAPGLHSSEETSQQWRAVGDIVSDFTDPEIEPQTSRINSDILRDDCLVEQNACKNTTFLDWFCNWIFIEGVFIVQSCRNYFSYT